jgi:hypothetical protein
MDPNAKELHRRSAQDLRRLRPPGDVPALRHRPAGGGEGEAPRGTQARGRGGEGGGGGVGGSAKKQFTEFLCASHRTLNLTTVQLNVTSDPSSDQGPFASAEVEIDPVVVAEMGCAPQLDDTVSGFALQHPEHVATCNAGAKKTIAFDLADMSNFVAHGRD